MKTIAKFLSCILITLGTAAVIIQVLFMFGWAEKAVGWRATIAVIAGTTVSSGKIAETGDIHPAQLIIHGSELLIGTITAR